MMWLCVWGLDTFTRRQCLSYAGQRVACDKEEWTHTHMSFRCWLQSSLFTCQFLCVPNTDCLRSTESIFKAIKTTLGGWSGAGVWFGGHGSPWLQVYQTQVLSVQGCVCVCV